MCFSGDSPDCWTRTMRKARKEHRCCECSNEIHKGDMYEYVSGIWNGEAATYKTCAFCNLFRHKIGKIEHAHGCYGAEAEPCYGELLEVRREYAACWVETIKELSNQNENQKT